MVTLFTAVMFTFFAVSLLSIDKETRSSKDAYTIVCPCPEKHGHWLGPYPVLRFLTAATVGAVFGIIFVLLFGWVKWVHQ